MEQIVTTLFVNFTILVTFGALLSRFCIWCGTRNKPIRMQILLGTYCTLLSIISMAFPIVTPLGTADLRSAPVVVAGIFGGPLVGGMVGGAVALYQMFQMGRLDFFPMLVFINSGIIAGLFSKIVTRGQKHSFNVFRLGYPLLVIGGYNFLIFRLLQSTIYAGIATNLKLHLIFIIGSTIAMSLMLQDVFKLQEYRERMEVLANKDWLTGVDNYHSLKKNVVTLARRASEKNEALSVIFLDLDDFKIINDRFGHECGNEILKRVATRLRENSRSDDVVARYGGDEFVILLPRCGKALAGEIAARVQDAICAGIFIIRANMEPLHVSASVGVVTFPDDVHSAEELLGFADQAAYAAKTGGRNRIAIF
ncbi:MAG: diguanylate cyclase [Bacillota bacterium]